MRGAADSLTLVVVVVFVVADNKTKRKKCAVSSDEGLGAVYMEIKRGKMMKGPGHHHINTGRLSNNEQQKEEVEKEAEAEKKKEKAPPAPDVSLCMCFPIGCIILGVEEMV